MLARPGERPRCGSLRGTCERAFALAVG